jgi:hypothetical protein
MLRHRGGCFGNLRGATGAMVPEAPCRSHDRKSLKTNNTLRAGLSGWLPGSGGLHPPPVHPSQKIAMMAMIASHTTMLLTISLLSVLMIPSVFTHVAG